MHVETMSVSTFQQHLLDLIRLHAQLVQSFWLASEVELCGELEDKLSQVWHLMRSDDSTVLQSEKEGLRPGQGISHLARGSLESEDPLPHEAHLGWINEWCDKKQILLNWDVKNIGTLGRPIFNATPISKRSSILPVGASQTVGSHNVP